MVPAMSRFTEKMRTLRLNLVSEVQTQEFLPEASGNSAGNVHSWLAMRIQVKTPLLQFSFKVQQSQVYQSLVVVSDTRIGTAGARPSQVLLTVEHHVAMGKSKITIV